MLLCEQLGTEQFTRRVKIYATDLDEAALNTARHAAYLPRDVTGVPEAFLEQVFRARQQPLPGQPRLPEIGHLRPP